MSEWTDRLTDIHSQLFGPNYDPYFWDDVNDYWRQQNALRQDKLKRKAQIDALPPCVLTDDEGIKIPGRSTMEVQNGNICVFIRWDDIPEKYRASMKVKREDIDPIDYPFVIAPANSVSVAEARSDGD